MKPPKPALTRREVLACMAAAARALAQTPANPARRIDTHHHFGNPAWVKMTNSRQSQGYQVWQPYTPAKSIEDMDRGGVATSLISVTTPGIWFGNKEETRRV